MPKAARWIGTGWIRGNDTVAYQNETPAFCEKRDSLFKLLEEKVKKGETGELTENSTGDPTKSIVGYNGYDKDSIIYTPARGPKYWIQ